MRPAAAVTMALLVCLPAAAEQGTEVHGEDSVFAGHGVTIAWGVLRAAAEAETQVVIRVVAPGGAYTHLDVEAVDPFTHARRAVVGGLRVEAAVEVRMPRASFADFPRREIRLWRAGRPALTVYYLGVPDTTPEFASEAGLRAYLDDAVAKARPAAGRPAP